MKRFISIAILMFALTSIVLVSCTPETIEQNEQQIDKDEIKEGDI